jgi:hypothetical protein
MKYSIATFCYGERYYGQTNRMIESFDQLSDPPQIFIVTDNPEAITKKSFVNVKHISDYNPKYSEYNKDYYTFDFSVKRFSVLFAFDSGYDNVILTDTDAMVNKGLFSHERVMECFTPNSISGQVTYNYNNEIDTNSMLGRRLLHYEKVFKVSFNKEELTEMPEDCIQFISIEGNLKYKFIEMWDKCIKIKDLESLPNVPAGNIDEMCFSALYNGIKVLNNSNKHINLLTPEHDKWY